MGSHSAALPPQAVATTTAAVPAAPSPAKASKRRPQGDPTAEVARFIDFLARPQQVKAVAVLTTPGADTPVPTKGADAAPPQTNVSQAKPLPTLLEAEDDTPAKATQKPEKADAPPTPKGDDPKATKKEAAHWLQAAPPVTALPVAPPIQVAFQQVVQAAEPLTGRSITGDKLLSQQMTQWLKAAGQTGAPIRLQVDHQLSLVLRLQNGLLSADFLNTTELSAQQVAQLQAQLNQLRQRLQEQRLPVGTMQARAFGDTLEQSSDDTPHHGQQQHPSNGHA